MYQPDYKADLIYHLKKGIVIVPLEVADAFHLFELARTDQPFGGLRLDYAVMDNKIWLSGEKVDR